MAASRPSAANGPWLREHSYAQEKLAEQFRNLLLEVEALIRQIDGRVGELEMLIRQIDERVVAQAGGKVVYASTVLGMKHLRNSLIKFHLFAFHYFVYIREGNPRNLAHQQLALSKIQNEIVPLRPLIEQRRAPHLLEHLHLADRLAFDFLDKCGLLNKPVFYKQRQPQPHQPQLQSHQPQSHQPQSHQPQSHQPQSHQPQSHQRSIESILVYFEETPLIRQGYDAYERVPSISLPTSTWCSPWLWLSLAHEVGHYVYHNLAPTGDADAADPRKNQLGLTLEERITAALEQAGASETIRNMWAGWLEELFADLFGALVLGPAYTESYICQWLLPELDDKGSRLLHNDGVHPPALLRPFVQLELLRKRMERSKRKNKNEQKLVEEIERVKRLWEATCAQLAPDGQQAQSAGDGFGYWLKQRISGERIGVRRCLETFAPVIAGTMLDMLAEYKTPDGKSIDVRFYDGDTHAAVELVADLQVQGFSIKPPQQAERVNLGEAFAEAIPTALLSVAWYAWSRMPKNAPLLQRPHESVERLRRWIGHVPAFVEPAPPPAPAELAQGVDALLEMDADKRPQSEDFVRLCAKLWQALEKNGGAGDHSSLCKALLEVEFSTRHALGANCCAEGWVKTGCVQPSRSTVIQ